MHFSKRELNDFFLDESGNVLLFTAVMLFFLILVTSTITLSVANRITLARTNADLNQEMSIAEQKTSSIESAVYEVMNQNDELTRYYIGMRYYRLPSTNFSGNNADLDTYLKELIDPAFQLQISTKMLDVPMNSASEIEECADVLFAYLMIQRCQNTLSTATLSTIAQVIDRTDASDTQLQVNSLSIGYLDGISLTSSYDEIKSVVTANKAFVKISYQTKYLMSSSALSAYNIDVAYEIRPYSYTYAIDNVIKPDETTQELKNKVFHYLQYKVKSDR